MGTGRANLSDHLDAAAIHEQMLASSGENSKFAVYDYNPDESADVQEFLIKYNMSSIPLDMDSMMGELDLKKIIMEGMSHTFDIAKPEISVEPETMAFDINSVITEQFAGLSTNPFQLLELGEKRSMEKSVLPVITFAVTPSFTGIRFLSGDLVITFIKGSEPSPDFEMNLKAFLYNKNTEISCSEGYQNVAQGGEIRIPLANREISSSLSLKFEGNINKGVRLKQDTYAISIELENPDIKELKGITLEEPVKIPVAEKTVPIDDVGTYVLSSSIAEGNIDIRASRPEGWKNITAQPDIHVTGGLDFILSSSESDESNLVRIPVDLADKALDATKDIVISGDIYFTLENADLTFPAEIVLDVTGDISKLKDIKASTESLSFLGNLEKTPTDSMLKYVKEMKVTGLHAETYFTSTFDTKENMKLKTDIMSTTLAMTSGTLAGTAEVNSPEPFEMDTKDSWSATVDFNVEPPPVFDFQFDVRVVSNKEEKGKSYIELNTLELGREYNIIVSDIEISLDWEYVTLKDAASLVETKPQLIDTGLNFESMISGIFSGDSEDEERKAEIKDIVKKVNFTDAEGYLYVTRPELAEGVSDNDDPLKDLGNFSANVYALYDDTKETYLVGKKDEKVPLAMLDKGNDDYDAIADEETRLITKNLFKDANSYSVKIEKEPMCEVINEKPENLKFGYTIGLAESQEIKLTPDLMDRLKGKKSISMSIVIRVPLILAVGEVLSDGTREGISIPNLMKLMGNNLTEDMLKRDEPKEGDGKTEFEKFSKLIKFLKVHYTFENNTGITMNARMVALNSENQEYIAKDILLDGTRNYVLFTSSEIDRINDPANYPFIPTFAVYVQPTEEGKPIRISRTAFFEARECVLEVETDGEYTVKGDD